MHDVCTISFKLNNLKTSVGRRDFWREGFGDQFFWIFWWTITGSSEFRIWPVKFEVAWFEVCYIWIQSTTIWKKPDTSKWIIEVSTELHISSSFFLLQVEAGSSLQTFFYIWNIASHQIFQIINSMILLWRLLTDCQYFSYWIRRWAISCQMYAILS